ncbi:hypothetical protein KIPB_006969 [Kipferlia bialata]|uniref:Uncharacterized protein n=1 Tax=Kipferlia bialata TaxID=797122 RepID=A0A9K3CYI8_9EUKA|nr:hypothetical protein KIPB_006969 [Kipferlia bialata]|eukprot:g6969.t1
MPDRADNGGATPVKEEKLVLFERLFICVQSNIKYGYPPFHGVTDSQCTSFLPTAPLNSDTNLGLLQTALSNPNGSVIMTGLGLSSGLAYNVPNWEKLLKDINGRYLGDVPPQDSSKTSTQRRLFHDICTELTATNDKEWRRREWFGMLEDETKGQDLWGPSPLQLLKDALILRQSGRVEITTGSPDTVSMSLVRQVVSEIETVCHTLPSHMS